MSAAAPLVAEVQPAAIGCLRLRNQCIAAPDAEAVRAAHTADIARACDSPLSVVERLGALQGQDYPGALWSIGLRVPGATAADVERAFEEREIVRTWPMRGTLHVIPAADARWMLELLTPRVIAGTAARQANLSLDDDQLDRAARLLVPALRGGNRLTREQMMALLDGAGISTAGQRGYHILFQLCMRRVLVIGPRAGKDQTFVLFDEWLPDASSLPAEESLALLVSRYFSSHGPASVKDFAGWSGLTMADTKRGLSANAETLIAETIGGTTYWMARGSAGTLTAASGCAKGSAPDVHLLPGFDEYLLGYKDRSAVLPAQHSERIVPGNNGMFKATVVIGGQVRGTWKRVVKRRVTTVEATAFERFTAAEQRAIDNAAERYLAFVGGW